MSFPESLKYSYYDVDINGDGQISVSEFRRYLKRLDIVDEKKIDEIIFSCDVDQTGIITEENFKVTFNVEVEFVLRPNDPLPEGVTVIATDMTPGMQKLVIRAVREEVDRTSNNKDLAKAIKTSLDRRVDKLFHVVVVKGQYWAYYSHEPKCSLVFSMGGLIFVVWKTPGY